MNVKELIEALQQYPDDAPVEVYAADGTCQVIITTDTNADEAPAEPLRVILLAELMDWCAYCHKAITRNREGKMVDEGGNEICAGREGMEDQHHRRNP